MSGKLRTAAQFIFGAAFFTYWCWTARFSLDIFSAGGSFTWSTFGLLLIPQVAMASAFFYSLWPEKESPEVPGRFLSVFSALILVIFWITGPIQSYFTFDMSGKQLSYLAFLYLWEVVVLGILFIYITMRWLGRVNKFLEDYSSDIKSITKERIENFSNFLSRFPINVAWLGFLFSLGGYALGSLQLVFWGGARYEAGIKTLMVGLGLSPLFAFMLYVLSYRFLRGIYEILYSFGEVSKPSRVLSIVGKIMIFGFGMLLMVVFLLFPLAWNFFEGNIAINTFALGGGIIFLELIIVFYIAATVFAENITIPLEILKKGLQILQTGEKRYRINVRTGDEIEEVINEFNKAAGIIDGEIKKR
ncbi:MAG TPA: hypothetical protein VMV71_01195 [Candidatus Paceibacterota bacterium]|nr:hypothetical protein [Candidatus Paceibacterota bacterium]